jgi:HJR/Mrr/RecB family endonuclease
MLIGCGQLSSADFDIRDLVPPGAPEIRDVPINADRLASMDCNFFEAFVATLWRKQGYDFVALTPKSGDGGVDVIAIRGGALIQCKSSSVDGNQLGWDAIKEVVGGTARYKAKYPGVDFKRICATNQAFNANAWDQARLNGVELLEREPLADLLELYPVTTLDVHNFRVL